MQNGAAISRESLALLVLALAGLAYLLLSVDITTASVAKTEFILLNFTLFFYLLWEIMRILRKERWRTLLHPAVLASVFHFMGSYFLPNLRYLSETNWWWLNPRLLFTGSDVLEHLNTAMWAILVAAFAMWRGYRSRVGKHLATRLRSLLLRKNIIRRDFIINFPVLFLLSIVSVGAFILEVKLGVFGYSADALSLESTQSIRAWIKLVSDGGTLVLIVLSIAVFTEEYKNRTDVWLLFILFLSWYVFIGLISGFKSQVVIPIVIVGICYYSIKGRLPIKLILLAILMIAIAYHVVESFRDLRYNSADFDNRSIVSIVSTVTTAATLPNSNVSDRVSTWEKTLSRHDLTTFTAQSILFKDSIGIPPDAPDFLNSILLSPLNAYIPRFLWQSKRIQNTGYWYNVNVLGTHPSTTTSVAMGPVSYAYFIGGYVAIFIIFWLLGFLQRLCFNTLFYSGIGGILIYLAIIQPLIKLPTDIGGMLAGFLRALPFVILAQYFLLKPGKAKYSVKINLGK